MASDSTLEIHCPACRWEPEVTSRWMCTCGCLWNTFDTAGVCPRCRHRWHDTQCLSCAAWAPHVDWYHGLDEQVAVLIEEALPASASARCTSHES